jgi:UDP-glucose 4-epimerase
MAKRKAFIEMTDWPPMMRMGMRTCQASFRIGSLPKLRDIHPWTRKEKTNVTWLPININIEKTVNTPLPAEVVEDYIRRSEHRSIVDFCGCRKAWECKHYPEQIGCLHMGETALETPKSLAHMAGVDEALRHLDKAVKAGLVPIIGKARVDNFIFGVKDRNKLLTVCFCCECCCITRNMKYLPKEHLDKIFVPLEGVSIEVTEECTGCGTCAERCFINAITIQDGRSVIGERCRACGRCATFCPQKAIKVRLDNPNFKRDISRRIDQYVKV